MGAWGLELVLDLEDLCTDLLVHRATSINLEKEGKDRFSKLPGILLSCCEVKHQ